MLEDGRRKKIDDELKDCTFKPATIELKGFDKVEVYKKEEKPYTYLQEVNSKYYKLFIYWQKTRTACAKPFLVEGYVILMCIFLTMERTNFKMIRTTIICI